MMQLQSSTVDVDGIKISYRRAGSGPAMMLVHGLVGSAHNWDRNMQELSRHRTVYALDLVNMGDSDRVAGVDAGLGPTADRIARLMDALAIDAADIAGHSHGGAVAMMLAARHPQRVRKLVLFAPANPYCEKGMSLIHFYNSWLGTKFARLIPAMPRMLHDFAYRRMHGDPASADPASLDGYTRRFNRESVDHVLRIVRRWTIDMALLRTRMNDIAALPVLLIWGDRDRAVGLSSGERLARRLGARIVVLPGVGHLPYAEAPEDSNRAMVEWLRT